MDNMMPGFAAAFTITSLPAMVTLTSPITGPFVEIKNRVVAIKILNKKMKERKAPNINSSEAIKKQNKKKQKKKTEGGS